MPHVTRKWKWLLVPHIGKCKTDGLPGENRDSMEEWQQVLQLQGPPSIGATAPADI